ncbi:MAG: single-stranded DNA-binding protein [Bacilli bacterium]|nr:single-stranded DNA-binding protein [Bacilli bacterium]
MNKVILVGRLTRDPEVRTLPTGNTVASFSLAINRTFKNKDGNVDADFINVSVFGRQAENVGKYVTKGSLIGCDGRIQTRSYDAQDGSKRYVTEVIADNVEFMSSGKNNASSSQGPVNAYVDTTSSVYMDEPSPEMGVDVSVEDPFKNFGSEVSLSDDDLPF